MPDWINAVASSVAVILSAVAIWRSFRTESRQQRIEDEQRARAAAAARSADLKVSIVREQNDYFYVIENRGPAAARSVTFDVTGMTARPMVEAQVSET